VVDIPETWVNALSERWKTTTTFTPDRLIFTERFALTGIVPDIFFYIPNSICRTVSECIMVDPIQSRAVTAHKFGLASLPYVYPRRLKIELALQGIWQTDEDVLHPKSSSKVMV
jgi:hypothetical protein